MANLATVLKEEISRLARKEIKRELEHLKRNSAIHRRDIAALKRKISDLEKRNALLEIKVLKQAPIKPKDEDTKLRFTAKGLKSQRLRLGFSAADYGTLIGVTGLTIYNWEKGATRPRPKQLERLAAVRQMGKKEAKARLRLLSKK